MTRYFVIVLLAASMVSLGAGGARAQPGPAELKARYPDGMVYLTFIPLADMRSCVIDPKKWERIKSLPGSQRLKEFLNSNFDVQMRKSAALLLLDFANGRAGFKRASDRDGSLVLLNWTKQDAIQVAALADTFLQSAFDTEQLIAAMKRDGVPLDEAIRNTNALMENPFTPKERLPEVLVELESLARKRSPDISALKARDPALWRDLQYLRQQKSSLLELEQMTTPRLELNQRHEVRLDRIIDRLAEEPSP
jgi:hypothetical protein